MKTLKELIALATQKPGVLKYAASSMGNSNHIAGEMLKAMPSVNIMKLYFPVDA